VTVGTYSAWDVGTYCYVAVKRGRFGGARRFGAHIGRRGAGHIVMAPAQLVLQALLVCVSIKLQNVTREMWTTDLSDYWLNTPEVRTSDDDDGGSCTVAVHHILDDNFNVAAAQPPEEQSFHHADVTFQPDNPLSSAVTASIPLPVLQFYDNEGPLEEQLVTPPVVSKITEPGFNTTSAVLQLSTEYSDPVTSTTFCSPLSENHQEQFILIQLPLNADDLAAILSRVTNNTGLISDNHPSHPHYLQQQQPTSENHLPTATTAAVVPCSGYQLHTSGGETGNDVQRVSEEDLMRMLDDAESIVVRHTVQYITYLLTYLLTYLFTYTNTPNLLLHLSHAIFVPQPVFVLCFVLYFFLAFMLLLFAFLRPPAWMAIWRFW